MKWNVLAKKMAAIGFPALGGALAGPAGASVGATLAKSLGVEASPDAVARMIHADPNTVIALRQIDAEMQAAEIEHVERAEDRREASVQEARAETKGHWLTPVLSLILVGMLIALGGALFFIEPPQSNRDLVTTLLGAVLGYAGATVAYWIGSSRGSADKSDTLDRIVSRK